MDALFDRIAEESDPRVKAVVALFLFKYIHPFPDANGRTGRFLMNALMAGAGLPWTVIPVDQRDRSMDCLEQASQQENIRPLVLFIEELSKVPPPPCPVKSAWSQILAQSFNVPSEVASTSTVCVNIWNTTHTCVAQLNRQ
jgi:hypothetical protein